MCLIISINSIKNEKNEYNTRIKQFYSPIHLDTYSLSEYNIILFKSHIHIQLIIVILYFYRISFHQLKNEIFIENEFSPDP